MNEASTRKALDDSCVPMSGDRLALGLEFPCTLKDIAQVLNISYDTLRNKWIGRIESAHQGLACPVIRNSSRRVTAYGFEAIQLWVDTLEQGKDTYRELIQAKYSNASENSVESYLTLVDHPVPTDFTSGQIVPVAQTFEAHPLVTVEFADLTYERPQSDTQALECQTLQAKAISANGAAAIQQFLAEDLKAKLANAMRQNDHLVATAQAGAIASGVESLGKPTPPDHPASA